MNHKESVLSFWLRALVVCLVFAIMTFASAHFKLEDALIYARYVKNALHGYGLVYNHGENVNALTSISDTWLQLGLSYLLGGRVLLAQAVLSGAFLLAACLVAEWLVPFAGLLVAVTPLFYFCGGMETSLFVLLIILTIWQYERGAIDWLPSLCVLTALTRFEGGLLLAIVSYRLFKNKQFPRALSYVPPILLCGFYFVFNWSFYHALLPQSATAKFGQGMSGFWGRWPTAFLRFPAILYEPFGTAWTYIPVLLTLAAFGAVYTPQKRRTEVAMPFVILLLTFYVLANIPSYYWYYGPIVYIGILYASQLIPTRTAPRLSFLFLVFLVSVGGFRILRRKGVEAVNYVQAGAWLEAQVPKDARIATVETGTIGWNCDRHIIDIVGLTTPENARYTAHRNFSAWFQERPDYVIVHPAMPFPWEKVVLQSPQYEMLPVSFGDVRIMRRK